MACPSRPACLARSARRALWIYSLAWWCLTPVLLASLVWRGVRRPGYLRAIPERFGFVALRNGEQRLIWVHAVSVGETRAAEPLLRACAGRWPDADLLLTHMTPTGRETGALVFADLIEAGRLRQAWLPWDTPGATRRMLARIRPAIGVLIETELWPNLIASAVERKVPMALVNARLSEQSLRKGERWSALTVPALMALDRVLAQTPSDAGRLGRLGRTGVPVLGNLKFDIEAPPAMLAMGARWRERLLSIKSAHGLVLAASTREGEEAMLLDAWARLRETSGDGKLPLLVIVPRHPQRFDEVTEAARARGWAVLRRSEFSDAGSGAELASESSPGHGPVSGPAPSLADVDLIIGDSMGELFAWYAMADVAIIGGSLAPLGGQNLIEACAVGCPVLLGPHTFNFEEISSDAIAAGAAIRVTDAEQAVLTATMLLTSIGRRQAMKIAALEFAHQYRGATRRTIDSLAPLID